MFSIKVKKIYSVLKFLPLDTVYIIVNASALVRELYAT